MQLETRIRQLETTADAENLGPPIVIYQLGQCPPDPSNDGRVRIFLPDNGRLPESNTGAA